VRKQNVLKLAAQFILKRGTTTPRKIQEEPTRLFVTAFHRDHDLDSVAPAFGRDDANQFELPVVLTNHVETDGGDFLLRERHDNLADVGAPATLGGRARWIVETASMYYTPPT
jgi:hypothetical protein